jgi:hypothetical protein
MLELAHLLCGLHTQTYLGWQEWLRVRVDDSMATRSLSQKLGLPPRELVQVRVVAAGL